MAFGAILGQKAGGLFPQITANLTPPESNITVTATLGTTSVSANSVDGVAVLKVPTAGNWTVSAEDQSANVNVAEEYSVSLKLNRGTPLSDLDEGDIVKIKENGSPVEFYVAKHDYESGLNGTGRTLVVRKDCYDNHVWATDGENAYANSTIDSWFNSTYKNILASNIRSLIDTTKIRYTPGTGNTSVSTLERAIFALSLTELGQSHVYANTEGSALPIANTLKIAYQNGSATTQWTRSPFTTNINYVWCLNSVGYITNIICNSTSGSRPAFTLPSTVLVDSNNNIIP